MSDSQHDDFYQTLRTRISVWAESRQGGNSRWTEYLLLAPDFFHLICRLSVDPSVSKAARARLLVLIAYFISPVDLLPEAVLGVLGFSDDLALTVYVLNSLLSDNREAIEKHWAGDGDVLEQMRKVLDMAEQMTGRNLWQKLKRLGRS